MSSTEENKSIKTQKISPPRQEENNVNLYPDWATIQLQASYGPVVPLQPPYFNSALMGDQVLPHPHVWAPSQAVYLLYGLPYPTLYSPAAVYTHPAVSLPSTPLVKESHSEISERVDQGSPKKLKSSNGISLQLGNDNPEFYAEESVHETSPRCSVDPDASSDEEHEHYSKLPFAPKIWEVNSVHVPNGWAAEGIPSDVQVQECHLKRERRKRANRESARRSRLKKQAVVDELTQKSECLQEENLALKSEIEKLTAESQKLMLENIALMEKLENSRAGQRTNSFSGCIKEEKTDVDALGDKS